MAAACVAAFLALLGLAYAVGPAAWVDAVALDGFTAAGGNPWVETVGEALVRVADPPSFLALTVVLMGVALVRGLPRLALAVGVLALGANVTTQVLKVVLAHPRHSDFLEHQIAPAAFPSGHATASMSLALAAVIVAPRGLRPLVAAVGAVFTIAVCFSFLALGWHFPSDVVGGYLVATAWGFLVLAGLRAAATRWPERSGREAAKRALHREAARPIAIGAIAGALGLVWALLVIAAAGTPPSNWVDFAREHTSAAVVAGAIAVAAFALAAGVAAATSRRG